MQFDLIHSGELSCKSTYFFIQILRIDLWDDQCLSWNLCWISSYANQFRQNLIKIVQSSQEKFNSGPKNIIMSKENKNSFRKLQQYQKNSKEIKLLRLLKFEMRAISVVFILVYFEIYLR